MHVYMSRIIENMGLSKALGRVGSHPPGMDPHAWREQVADDAARAVAGDWIGLEMAHDMIMVADLLVAEMIRYPEMIDWDNFLYAEAAHHGFEPANAAYEVRILPPNRVRIQGKLIGLYRKY